MDEQRELTLMLLQTAQGDARAFHRLYERVSTRLFSSALKILRDRALAEEALQEGFIAIWRHAARFDPLVGVPMAWMTTIVRRHALDLIRRRADRADVSTDDVDEAALGTSPSTEELLAGLEVSATVQRCLSQLEAKQRQALVLAYSQGLTHVELAAQLAQPLGTVKSWVRRGLASLKRCVDLCVGAS